MKALKTTTLALFALVISFSAMAQSKAEKKAMKKELKIYKKMKPAQVRAMKLGYESDILELKEQLAQSQKENSKIDSLQRLLNESANKMKMLEADVKAAQKTSNDAQNSVFTGYYYRVQLGAYGSFNINDKLTKGDNMQSESANGLDKYTVGYFKKYNDASNFVM
jgi:hypothetical protein